MSIREKVVDGNGRNVLIGLFKEFSRPDVKFKWLYTLPQMKNIFLDCRDPTEYKVAMTVVGDWEHWQDVRNHPLIKPYVDKWQEELAIRLRSEAIAQMREHARVQGGTAAAKWLADKGYEVGSVPKAHRGRPRKVAEEPDHSIVEEKLAKVLSLVGTK